MQEGILTVAGRESCEEKLVRTSNDRPFYCDSKSVIKGSYLVVAVVGALRIFIEF